MYRDSNKTLGGRKGQRIKVSFDLIMVIEGGISNVEMAADSTNVAP